MRSLPGVATAAVGAIFYLVPDLGPCLAPDHRAAAGGAGFDRQIGFAAHLHRSNLICGSGFARGLAARRGLRLAWRVAMAVARLSAGQGSSETIPQSLDDARELLQQATRILRHSGAVFLEVGWRQGQAVEQLAKKHFPFAEIKVMVDFAGQERIVSICNG